ncbi:MAG: DUF4350 domain-containing protein [Blastocatellia bacterium]
MRGYVGTILVIALILLFLAGMSAVGYMELERPAETEMEPNRSSYNTGPTGIRAFYQGLEDAGYQVARWRGGYRRLQAEGANAALIMVGPSRDRRWLDGEEQSDLKQWVAGGGRLLIISRRPEEQFGFEVMAVTDDTASEAIAADPTTGNLIDKQSDALIAQPTALTRDTQGLALSRLSSRLVFGGVAVRAGAGQETPQPTATPATRGETRTLPAPVATQPPPPPAARLIAQETKPDAGDPPPPPPRPLPTPSPSKRDSTMDRTITDRNRKPTLDEAVFHLADEKGAALADFNYGRGRIVFLSDPYVIANNGVRQGANVRLALNLVEALGGRGAKVFFDETLHGFEDVSNPLLEYFRGTSVLWVLGQLLLVAALIAVGYGRRFARPLPLPAADRHSPLEFVDSMAHLQQTAQARDLAIENIYPRFRARLCRRLGLPARATAEEIAVAIERRRIPVSPAELRQVIHDSEAALKGQPLDDQKLLRLVTQMRHIIAQLG